MISFLSGGLSNFGLNLTKRNCHCLTHQPAPGGKLASLFRSLSVRQQTTFLRRHSLKCILIIKIKTKIGNLKFSSSSHSIISHSGQCCETFQICSTSDEKHLGLLRKKREQLLLSGFSSWSDGFQVRASEMLTLPIIKKTGFCIL